MRLWQTGLFNLSCLQMPLFETGDFSCIFSAIWFLIVFSVLAQIEMYMVRSSENGMYYCKLCEYTTSFKRDLARHIESRHLDLEYTCYYCDKVLKTKRTYQQHLRKFHPNQHHANTQWNKNKWFSLVSIAIRLQLCNISY